MKGFIKVLEAVIASIILLTALAFFFTGTTSETSWDEALLRLRASDVLVSLERNGTLEKAVFSNDPSLIETTLLDEPLFMLPPTIDYSLIIEGIPNPVIRISCLCNAAERQRLEQLLVVPSGQDFVEFSYKERTISVRLETTDIDSIRPESDILLAFSSSRFMPSSYSNPLDAEIKLNASLEEGTTFFLISNLGPEAGNGAGSNNYLKRVFNLTRIPGPGSPSGEFVNDENTTSFRIAKYYANLSGLSFNADFFSPPPSFTFSSNTIGENKNSVLATSDGYSHMQTNKGFYKDSERSLWIADLDENTDTRMKNLTMSAILWASGEKYALDTREKTPIKDYTTSSLFVHDRDIYKATLIVWRVFQ